MHVLLLTRSLDRQATPRERARVIAEAMAQKAGCSLCPGHASQPLLEICSASQLTTQAAQSSFPQASDFLRASDTSRVSIRRAFITGQSVYRVIYYTWLLPQCLRRQSHGKLASQPTQRERRRVKHKLAVQTSEFQQQNQRSAKSNHNPAIRWIESCGIRDSISLESAILRRHQT